MKPVGKILGLGVLGCLVCCGGPVVLLLLGGMGFGAATAELMSCYHDPLSLAVGSVVLTTLLALAFRKWRAPRNARCSCPPV
jgi:hypothetical protein